MVTGIQGAELLPLPILLPPLAGAIGAILLLVLLVLRLTAGLGTRACIQYAQLLCMTMWRT
eukprot:1138057-Pelagomonas_calceolata.AAC.4